MKNQDDLQQVFGMADPGFVNAVHHSLDGFKREEANKNIKKFSLSIAFALVACLLLATVAFAAASQMGMFDFVRGWGQSEVLPEAEQLVLTEFEGATTQQEMATFSIRDAIFDGRNVFLTVEVKPTDKKTLFLGLDAYPGAPAHELVGEERGGDMTVEEYAIANGMTKTYTASIRVDMEDKDGGAGYEIFLEEDGTLVFIINCMYMGDNTDKVDIDLTCSTVPYESDGTNMDERESSVLEVTLYNKGIEMGTDEISWQSNVPTLYTECGLQIQRVTFNSTPLGHQYKIVYAIVDEALYVSVDGDLSFEFIDSDGNWLPDGTGRSGQDVVEGADVPTYELYGSLAPTMTLPDTLIIRAYDGHTKDRYGVHEFTRE